MNSTAPSSSAFAHTGWNLGSENSSPSTLPPIAAPRRPCFFTAVSSCRTARSGYCSASEANAAKRSGREALLDDDEMLLGTFYARHHAACLVPHQSERLVEVAVRVHIDGLDPLAVDSHGQTLAIGPLAPRHIAHRAAAEHNARCACGLDKVAPRRHGRPLPLDIRVSCAFTTAGVRAVTAFFTAA